MNIPQSVGERLRYVGRGDGRVTWRLGISRRTVYRGVDAVRIRKVSKVRYSASCIVTLVSINMNYRYHLLINNSELRSLS